MPKGLHAVTKGKPNKQAQVETYLAGKLGDGTIASLEVITMPGISTFRRYISWPRDC